jgi:basic membrane protein A
MKSVGVLAVVGAFALALMAGSASSTSRQLRVAFVTDIVTPSKAHDLRAAAYRGFLRAVRDFHLQGRVVQSNPTKGLGWTLAALGRQQYDLIFTGIPNSDQDFQAIGTVAARFPRSKFVLIDGVVQALRTRPKNVQGSLWRVEQAAYLAGYLAAVMEKKRPGRDVVGAVGGVSFPPINAFIAGYEAGGRKADPGIKTIHSYANNFLDAAKCRSVALNQIARGAGVEFDVAGLCGLGTLRAAKEKGAWGIGVDVDQSYLGPHILTSVLKGANGQDIYLTVKAFVQGRFKAGGNSVWNLRNGAVGLGKISPKVPRSFVRQVATIRKQIIVGKITVQSALGKQ